MQQFELSEELVSQIEGLIKADNKEDVSKLVEPLHSADIAEIMNELDTKEAQFLFLLLDKRKPEMFWQKSKKTKDNDLSILSPRKL